MNLYANESNPCALKLLLCAEFGKKHVELKLVKLQGMFDNIWKLQIVPELNVSLQMV